MLLGLKLLVKVVKVKVKVGLLCSTAYVSQDSDLEMLYSLGSGSWLA